VNQAVAAACTSSSSRRRPVLQQLTSAHVSPVALLSGEWVRDGHSRVQQARGTKQPHYYVLSINQREICRAPLYDTPRSANSKHDHK